MGLFQRFFMKTNKFWYIFASTGKNAFLIDWIVKEGTPILRAAFAHDDGKRFVRKEEFKPTEVTYTEDEILINTVKLTKYEAQGIWKDVALDLHFQLTKRHFEVSPLWIHTLRPQIPFFTSRYGFIDRGTCNHKDFSNTPIAWATYEAKKLSESQWTLISCSGFDDKESIFEVASSKIFGQWASSAYLFFKGKEYKLNNPFSNFFNIKMKHCGEAVNNTLEISGRVRYPDVEIIFKGSGDEKLFLLFEQEGNTQIKTCLLGDLDISIKIKDETYTFEPRRKSLLEIKK